MPRRPPSTARLFLARIALVIGATLATLIGAEPLLRAYYLVTGAPTPQQQLRRASTSFPRAVTGPCVRRQGDTLGFFIRGSEDERIIFELKPSVDGCWEHYGIRVKANRLGFRADREYDVAKPPGTFRIVGIGDSFMFGWGVEGPETYATALEQRLSRSLEHPVEFINTALGGYNTVNEVAVLERHGLALAPDLILLHWCGNDYGVPFFLKRPVRHVWARRSVLLSLIVDVLSTRRYGDLDITLAHSPDLEDGLINTDPRYYDVSAEPVLKLVPEEYRDLMGPSAVRAAFERLATISRDRQIPVVVIGLDDPSLVKMVGDLGLVPLEHPWPAEWALSPDDAHLSPKGHAEFAAVLEELLLSKRLVQ